MPRSSRGRGAPSSRDETRAATCQPPGFPARSRSRSRRTVLRARPRRHSGSRGSSTTPRGPVRPYRNGGPRMFPTANSARAWSGAGLGEACSSPSTISATIVSGTLTRSSYVARRSNGGTRGTGRIVHRRHALGMPRGRIQNCPGLRRIFALLEPTVAVSSTPRTLERGSFRHRLSRRPGA